MTSWNKGIPEREETKLKKKETFAAKRALITYTEKACKKCGEIKQLVQFPKKKDAADGHLHNCRTCDGERKSKYTWSREQWWEWEIKRHYGITKDEYNSILESQHCSCAICQIHLDDYAGIHGNGKKVERFSVDHCHTTGKVRGLLCFRCNLAIGYAQDNPDIMEKAAQYIRERQ
jgi:hypothetical protein